MRRDAIRTVALLSLIARVLLPDASILQDLATVKDMRRHPVASVGTISIDHGSRRESHLTFTGGAVVVLPRIGPVHPLIEVRLLHAMTGAPNDVIV